VKALKRLVNVPQPHSQKHTKQWVLLNALKLVMS
jgi:hypothetical protein